MLSTRQSELQLSRENLAPGAYLLLLNGSGVRAMKKVVVR
jgi:hypothetical protein